METMIQHYLNSTVLTTNSVAKTFLVTVTSCVLPLCKSTFMIWFRKSSFNVTVSEYMLVPVNSVFAGALDTIECTAPFVSNVATVISWNILLLVMTYSD